MLIPKKLIYLSLALVLVGSGIVLYNKAGNKNFNPESSQTEQISNNSQENKDANREKRDMEGQYSFGLSVCEEVSQELVASVIDKPVVATEDHSTSNDTGCKYFTNKEKNEYVSVNVVYLEAENQRKGQQILGRSITTSPQITLNHFIAIQEDNQTINAIYLIMAPKKIVRVDRSSLSVTTNEQLVDLAAKVSDIILYK